MISKEFKFKTALSRENIPPPTAGWKFDTSLFPRLTQETIETYQSAKRQGKKGQYRKALRMFQSRRMKSIKVLKEGEHIFIKANVLKSFASEVTRTVTVQFNGNCPQKAYCECAVGKCGLCCHSILVLLQLKHFTLYGKLILALTCTQKLQTWHQPRKGQKNGTESAIKTASHIRLKYLRNLRSARRAVAPRKLKKKVQATTNQGTNIERSDWFARDVTKMSTEVENGLVKTDANISNHFFKTLNKYNIASGLHMHLSYGNAYQCRLIQHDHNYAKQSPMFDSSILSPRFTGKCEDVWHSVLVPSKEESISSESITRTGDSLSHETVFCKEKTDELLNLMSQSSGDTITIKLPKCEQVKICASNYVDVVQGTKEWFACRRGVITASKLPSLLGFHGQKEFDTSWFCVHNKLDESTFAPKKFRNFHRGKVYEAAALENFSKMTGKL